MTTTRIIVVIILVIILITIIVMTIIVITLIPMLMSINLPPDSSALARLSFQVYDLY